MIRAKEDKSVTLETYLGGMTGIDYDTVLVAGEDLVEGVMCISIYDLPSWIESGAKFKLKMTTQDFKLIRNFFLKKPISKILEVAAGTGLEHIFRRDMKDYKPRRAEPMRGLEEFKKEGNK